ncbi:hypothetical protein [Rhizobium sp. MHM7A]|uniref:hypothetical protein n=1 Tax=Rhizobium sp. MHM7A TaxID=2583233 RepID=UPI001105A076|nr:hypothetical protein [Rhizobium sp. MHM7A]TLX17129.1 hypothetical protein FFR93_07405 [Rhizobium sp. MHM7A]
MGNHDVGRGMAAAARAFWIGNGDAEVSPEKAMAALDAAAEDYIGADAEFDDEMSGYTPLSRLVAIAFEATPEELADLKGEREVAEDDEDDEEGLLWYDGPYARFSDRYKFC